MLVWLKIWFLNDWFVINDDGQEILFDFLVWCEWGEFEFDGCCFEFDKDSVFSLDFCLCCGDWIVV